MTSKILLGMLLVALATSGAQGGSSGKNETLVLKNGKTIHGAVVKLAPDTVTLRFTLPGGSGEVTVKESQAVPQSWYKLQSHQAGNDVATHLRLADYAMQNGMFFQAERELNFARSLDPTVEAEVGKKLEQIRSLGAARLVELASAAVKSGDFRKAQRLASTVRTRFAGTSAAEAASRVLDLVTVEQNKQRAQALALKAKKSAAKNAKKMDAIVASVQKEYEGGLKRNLDGLKENSSSRSMGHFKAAIALHEKAMKMLDALVKKSGTEAGVVERLKALRPEIQEATVEAHINLGSGYLVRGSFPNALMHANHAIAADSTNNYARQFRARVEQASAEAAGWRRGVQGRR